MAERTRSNPHADADIEEALIALTARLNEHGHEHEHPTATHEHVELIESFAGLLHDLDAHDHRQPWREAVRALLTVFEVGHVNTEQRKAIRQVRVLLGDIKGSGCTHENTAYEEGDVLICQDCRAEVA